MLRVVLDTVVFVRALINSRGACGRLVFLHRHRYRLFLSPPVVAEILEVLAREDLIERFRLRDVNYAAALSSLIESVTQAGLVELDQIPAISRDPEDDKFLATAQAANAQYLVSEDNDLLVLQTREGTEIVNAGTFLSILEQTHFDG